MTKQGRRSLDRAGCDAELREESSLENIWLLTRSILLQLDFFVHRIFDVACSLMPRSSRLDLSSRVAANTKDAKNRIHAVHAVATCPRFLLRAES